MHCICNSSLGNCTSNCRVYIDRKDTFVGTFYIFADAGFSFNILAKTGFLIPKINILLKPSNETKIPGLFAVVDFFVCCRL